MASLVRLATFLLVLVHAPAQGSVITDEAAFHRAAPGATTASFNAYPVGFLQWTGLPLGSVAFVRLTNAGAAPIFAPPGPFDFGFTTNFLSTGVADGGNNVVIEPFSPLTVAVGMRMVSVHPVSVIVDYVNGSESFVFSSSRAAFLGFVATSGQQAIASVRISVPPEALIENPIVNIGEVTSAPRPTAVESTIAVPGLSAVGLLVLSAAIVLIRIKALRS